MAENGTADSQAFDAAIGLLHTLRQKHLHAKSKWATERSALLAERDALVAELRVGQMCRT